MKFCSLSFLKTPNDLDPSPSYKMDLDFWDCSGRKKLGLIAEEYVMALHSRNSGCTATKKHSVLKIYLTSL